VQYRSPAEVVLWCDFQISGIVQKFQLIAVLDRMGGVELGGVEAQCRSTELIVAVEAVG
jgi:hypothetical protein